jgi:glycosyltransferase involved in cell wall biosynthesis
MHVLILSPEEPPHGLLRALVALGVSPTVLIPRGESSTDGAISFIRVPSRGDPSHAVDLRWSRKALRSVIRDAAPSLVHIVSDPWTPTAEAGAAACRKLGLPYVLVGTTSSGGPRGIVARWQADRVRDGAAGLAGIGRPALERLIGAGSTRPTAVLASAGIPLPSLAGRRLPETPIRLAVVGRVVKERGLDLLFDALAEAYGDWRLRIVGTGPMQEALEAQAQRLGLSARIEWLGALPRTALAALWADSDAIVAPSRTQAHWVEPTGSVVLEAMAHGLAAIVSRCGALPDVVGDAGLVIAEEDREALTRALKALIDQPSRCAALGELARQQVERSHSDAAVAERMVAFWRRVMAVQAKA